MSAVDRTAWAGTMRYQDAVMRGWAGPRFAIGRMTSCGRFFRIFSGPNAERKARRDVERGAR